MLSFWHSGREGLQPGVFEGLVAIYPLSGSGAEQLLDQVLALLRYNVELLVVEVVVARRDGLNYFIIVGALEREMATNQGVENYS